MTTKPSPPPLRVGDYMTSTRDLPDRTIVVDACNRHACYDASTGLFVVDDDTSQLSMWQLRWPCRISQLPDDGSSR